MMRGMFLRTKTFSHNFLHRFNKNLYSVCNSHFTSLKEKSEKIKDLDHFSNVYKLKGYSNLVVEPNEKLTSLKNNARTLNKSSSFSLKVLISHLNYNFLNFLLDNNYRNDHFTLDNIDIKLQDQIKRDKFSDKFYLHEINYNTKVNMNKFIIVDKLFFHFDFDYSGSQNFINEIRFFEKFDTGKITYRQINKDETPSMSPLDKKVLVRLGTWIKSPYLILPKSSNENLHEKLKIHNEEWHHMLLEFEQSIDNLLEFYSFIYRWDSFIGFSSRFLKHSLYQTNSKEKDKNLAFSSKFAQSKVKIVDYDFALKGNPLTSTRDIYGRDELYYLQGRSINKDEEQELASNSNQINLRF